MSAITGQRSTSPRRSDSALDERSWTHSSLQVGPFGGALDHLDGEAARLAVGAVRIWNGGLWA